MKGDLIRERCTLRHGDCIKVMRRRMKPRSVDLVVTSPPYAMQRKHTYGGIPEDKYVDWFLEVADGVKRVLKPKGSFILNIKEHCEDGQRSDYVYKLAIDLREIGGWRRVDELIWHKKNAVPGHFPGRFRDHFERLFHFTKEKDHAMYKEHVRLKRKYKPSTHGKNMGPGGTDIRVYSPTGSGFNMTWKKFDKDWSDAGNVLHGVTTAGTNVGHSAAFPLWLPTWFIKAFTKEGDVVFDPFVGSGTTILAALDLGRVGIGIEMEDDAFEKTRKTLVKRLNGVATKDLYPRSLMLPDVSDTNELF